jgi:hypothetical protein
MGGAVITWTASLTSPSSVPALHPPGVDFALTMFEIVKENIPVRDVLDVLLEFPRSFMIRKTMPLDKPFSLAVELTFA